MYFNHEITKETNGYIKPPKLEYLLSLYDNLISNLIFFGNFYFIINILYYF